MTIDVESPDSRPGSYQLQAAKAPSTKAHDPEPLAPSIVEPISDEIFHRGIVGNLSNIILVFVAILFISEVILNWSH